MKKTIIACDVCGADLDQDEWHGEYNGIDICFGCATEISKILPVVKPPEDKKPKRNHNGRRKELDDGKLKALVKAGWKAKDIAIEFGCSEQTIYNHIRQMEANE